MAYPTAEDITRIFGSRSGTTNAALPQPSVNLTPTGGGAVASMQNQMQQLKQTPTGGGAGAPLAPPSFPRPPAPAPAPLPNVTIPPSTSTGSSTFQRGGTGDSFQPQQYEPSFDPELVALLKQRAAGEGVGPTYEQIQQGTYAPLAGQIDTAFNEAESDAARDLARRGILSSGEAADRLGDLRTEQGRQKAALAGQLALDFENNRQQNINAALQQYAGLEQGRVSAKTSITTANIGASAQVQSASIMASAQVASANASANAQVAAARIGAQAALQRANMDFNVAMRTIDNEMVFAGIDPVRFENDPVYRGDSIAYRAFVENTKNELMFAQANALNGLTATNVSNYSR